ncbi:hypothetical protein [Actinomadura parmotrematis]|uniref:Uncharacterized protein n=1 Tax=Actinomadura parmotrematis TaxID=2864039 RepID=A0ABS7G2N4_9ACTN|nr:hypothetical protein [Actinomadura parmotrematis]MBW8486978.1 hypothetical protein [Actinomadura parmotrematis]
MIELVDGALLAAGVPVPRRPQARAAILRFLAAHRAPIRRQAIGADAAGAGYTVGRYVHVHAHEMFDGAGLTPAERVRVLTAMRDRGLRPVAAGG